jgi:hypothetical protein
VLGPFLYQQILYMTLWGWLVFGQVPDAFVVAGAAGGGGQRAGAAGAGTAAPLKARAKPLLRRRDCRRASQARRRVQAQVWAAAPENPFSRDARPKT